MTAPFSTSEYGSSSVIFNWPAAMAAMVGSSAPWPASSRSPARHDLLEILEERYARRSTILTSQLPIEKWHEVIGNPTYADAVFAAGDGIVGAEPALVNRPIDLISLIAAALCGQRAALSKLVLRTSVIPTGPLRFGLGRG